MHPYYNDNRKKFRKEMNGFLSLIRKELEEKTGEDYTILIEKIWNVYQSGMLENFPYIGGDQSSGTHNLTGAFVFVAMGEVCRKEYGMTLEDWGYLTTLCYRRYFDKIPGWLAILAGKLFKKTRLVNKMLKMKDKKNAENAKKYPGSFETKTQQPTEECPANYHTLVCPLANFAKDYGYMDYMPYLCNLDYVMFERIQVPFYREHTCADGDGYCDFKMKAGAPVNSSWPCHQLTEGDPLK